MKKYRKKPVEIEAVQLTDNDGQIVDWITRYSGNARINNFYQIEIVTLEGTMTAFPGDWIIRGVQGEFYPCKPDIFKATYEEVK